MSNRRILLGAALIGLLAIAAASCGQDVRTLRSADGTAIVYESFGSGEPALVLVHGWTNNRTFWRPHVEALARSHRVVTLDLAGFGDSGASRSDWTMELFGEDVAAVVRALPESDIVAVGFSMGGAPKPRQTTCRQT